jgi:junctophilin
MRKQRSTGDLEKRITSGGSIRSTASETSWMSTESSQSGPNGGSLHTDSNASFVVEVNTTSPIPV